MFDVDLIISIDRVGGRMKFSHRLFKDRIQKQECRKTDSMFRELFSLVGWRKYLALFGSLPDPCQ